MEIYTKEDMDAAIKLITDEFNTLFPLNTVIVFILISISAYILKVITSLFLQILSSAPFNLKEAIKIY